MEELLKTETKTLGTMCENCGWWIRCLTELTEENQVLQYSCCFERGEPHFVFP